MMIFSTDRQDYREPSDVADLQLFGKVGDANDRLSADINKRLTAFEENTAAELDKILAKLASCGLGE